MSAADARRKRSPGGSQPDEIELWLLDELSQHRGAALDLFCPCSVDVHMNRSVPYDDLDVVTDALLGLRRREWIEFARGEKVFEPRRDALRRRVSTHSCSDAARGDEIGFVGLTPVGGAAWSREFDADWDQFVEVDSADARWCDLRCPDLDTLERVVRRLPSVGVRPRPGTVRWIPPSLHRAPAWREPVPMHRVVFEPHDDPVLVTCPTWIAVTSACPRWCSPWSVHAQYTGVAVDEDDGRGAN